MNLQIVWTDTGAKEYDGLPADVRERLDEALYQLVIFKRGSVKRLHGMREVEYRLRVGDYRIRFSLPKGTGESLIHHLRRSQAERAGTARG